MIQNEYTPHVVVRRKKAGNSVDPRTIRRRAIRLLNHLDQPKSELSIVLCNDSFIQELNRDYRELDKPTDVLSFPLMEKNEDDILLLGDIIISIETAKQQAIDLKHNLLTEVTSLLIHGILHLLGFDHKTKEDERNMTQEAIRLEKLF